MRKLIITVGFLFFLVACSTKRDSFLSRNSHALSTEYNILYNGQIGLDKGIKDIQSNLKDNFWERLPIEKMQMPQEESNTPRPANANFELAETKATKAIQKHSMNIDAKERNPQIDEAYLLLGKARYYEQRFLPALDAFNYILYKYPNSSKIYEAKIWREKTNMRLGNDALVVNNISTMLLLKQKELKKQILSDANALLSEAYLNLEEKDSAIAKLKLAAQFTTNTNDKGRYLFILGQLYQELGQKDSARYNYNAVIKQNRKSDRKYLIHAQVRKAQLFDPKAGDTTLFLKRFNKLLQDRENRPYLAILNHQMGAFFDQQGQQNQAIKYYTISLNKTKDQEYLMASNYRNLANLYFKNAKYPIAAKYYDSTLVKLNPKTREFNKIDKIRKDLDEVILYESIAAQNDSILNLIALTPEQQKHYFENHIEKLKKAEQAQRVLEAIEKEKQENIARNSAAAGNTTPIVNQAIGLPPTRPDSKTGSQTNSSFYFYNPTTVAYGKVSFKKIWGNRSGTANWRLQNTKNSPANALVTAADSLQINPQTVAEAILPENHTTAYYIQQLPTAQRTIDSISKERNTAYYQLGVIYKEKFKEYALATQKLEQLLVQNPEEKLILPTKYNLYKIYQITNKEKAAALHKEITSQYPDSRYAQILNHANPEALSFEGTPQNVYNAIYQRYQEEQYTTVLENLETAILQFSGEEIVSKLELLKANTVGKLQGLAAYKTSLQYVMTNYPNTEEGKKANEILNYQIPDLEKITFTTKETFNWKILYLVGSQTATDTQLLEEKIKKWIASPGHSNIRYSLDSYTATENFISLHGFSSETQAKNSAVFLRDNKAYKIAPKAILITNENYKVIQINKNLTEFLQALKQ
ncbi:gliding motility protein [Flavobacterium crassostreae]|uniref:Gliding motility protein n=2 Tax=Flavobacterium crassostreae TaxID=1763534 RepID=A0A1B9E5K1_9FLAO|nr:tetratricopeptide repeat protein [Flavobacterium crassostreae]OCB77226.1 gliding motility protein [Flavobacterium crassostreae]